MSQKNSLTWFITGCSSGFGRELTILTSHLTTGDWTNIL
jgi:NADP-dependent 3-hydroxy acid dehydrogenase YdfG